MRTTAFRGTPLWRFLPVLFLSTFLPAAHATPTLTLMFGEAGVYPQRATINSQRWFRVQATWDYKLVDDGYGVGGKVRAERVDELTLQEPSPTIGGLSFNAGFGGDLWNQGASQGVARKDDTAGELGKRTLTVGPFAGMRYQHLVGRVGGGKVNGALGLDPQSTHTVKWILRWSKYDATDIDPGAEKQPRGYVSQTPIELTATYDSVPVNPGGGGWISGGGDVGELVYWYSSDASGVPPLEVIPQDATNPNAGSSSMTYIFRCVLWNIVPNTRPIGIPGKVPGRLELHFDGLPVREDLGRGLHPVGVPGQEAGGGIIHQRLLVDPVVGAADRQHHTLGVNARHAGAGHLQTNILRRNAAVSRGPNNGGHRRTALHQQAARGRGAPTPSIIAGAQVQIALEGWEGRKHQRIGRRDDLFLRVCGIFRRLT
jgi:hypothetical protein